MVGAGKGISGGLCNELVKSDVLGDGHQVAVLDEDGLEGRGGRFHLTMEGRVLRRFKSDLERRTLEIVGSAEDAVEALARDDAVVGGKAVNLALAIAGKELLGFAQGGLEKILREDGTGDVTVNAVAGIVRVQIDDAVKGVEPDF